ncbi:hypothetical protein GCM10011430_26530 [Oxalicibacterium solurbis]|uniref:Uncharacterized protein n=1 Tax=Oxalicibacterium solurbis TaxID=69280 RepID=A0A8J3AXS0_9BURK|nr:hypothetical protein GCM10011430_26530 [Oxalicibacterium solurbis]
MRSAALRIAITVAPDHEATVCDAMLDVDSPAMLQKLIYGNARYRHHGSDRVVGSKAPCAPDARHAGSLPIPKFIRDFADLRDKK